MVYPPIKVTQKQYDIIRTLLAGHIFHRIKDDCYWVRGADKFGSDEIDEILKWLG